MRAPPMPELPVTQGDHAHVRYDRADSIILTQDDYHEAYSHRRFVRLLGDLFAFQRPVYQTGLQQYTRRLQEIRSTHLNKIPASIPV